MSKDNLFASVKKNIQDGIVYTADSIQKGFSAAKDGVVRTYTVTRDGVVESYAVVRDGIVTIYREGKVYLKGKVGDVAVRLAAEGANWATEDKSREQALVEAVDKRSLYTAKAVCVECEAAAKNGKNPNPNDGKFLGENCTPTDTVPKVGRFPQGCSVGCKLPRIYFTNGINNTESQVCEAMQTMAEIKCAEVIGIYNATFADSSKVTPPDPAPKLAREDKNRAFYRIDQKIADEFEYQYESGKAALADKAGRVGLTQDVLDCIDNIDSAGTEQAAHTQAALIHDSLSRDPAGTVTLYAHSQGGLITQEGLTQARGALYSERYAALVTDGVPDAKAKSEAAAFADKRMKSVSVVSFGTAESNWPSGPNYKHYTNTRDPVPALIQSVLSNRGVDTSKTGGPVDRFTASPSFDPMEAHGMKETYLPRLQEVDSAVKVNGKCCA